MHLGVDTKVCESSTRKVNWAGRLTHVNTIVILCYSGTGFFFRRQLCMTNHVSAPSRCLLDSKSGDETMGAHWKLGQKSRIASSHLFWEKWTKNVTYTRLEMICKNWDHNSILLGEKPDLKLLSCHASQSWVALIASQSGVLIIVSNIWL